MKRVVCKVRTGLGTNFVEVPLLTIRDALLSRGESIVFNYPSHNILELNSPLHTLGTVLETLTD